MFMGVELAELFMLVVPDALVAAVVLFVPVALRVASTALGEVRTTVAVSLRGTAFLVASAAACGVTPTAVAGWLALVAGIGLVCARATVLPVINAAIHKILVLFKSFMVKVPLVG